MDKISTVYNSFHAMNKNPLHSQSRINIGCGRSPTSGWINFDASPSLIIARIPRSKPFLSWTKGWLLSTDQLEFIEFARKNQIKYGNVVKGLPLASGSCSTVYASHVLEHLQASEVKLFFREIERILAPGGIVRLAVPDLQILIDIYQSNMDADQFVHSLYFFPTDQGGPMRNLASRLTGNRTLHRWIYNELSLKNLLKKSGFINPISLRAGETTISDPGALDLHERSWESLYMEAVKV